MSFRKKILTVCLLIAAVLCVPLILVCFAFAAPAQYDLSFYGGMRIKHERLKSVNGRKIVVIGGSSVAFGLRSDIMEKEMRMPVVNFGLYANLGTKYMLDVAEKYIDDGDIVVIAPEQNNQALSLYYNAEAVWYSVDGNFGILADISENNYGDMAKAFLKFTGDKFKYWQSGDKPSPDGIYNVRSFNAYGDIEYAREYNVMNGGFDARMPVSFDRSVIDVEFIEYVNKYSAKLKERGAEVFYTFSPMNAGALDQASTADVIEDYYTYISSALDVAIVGNPYTHLLHSDWFYDSNFHLNDSGAINYTVLLAQELKAELNDFTPILTPTPDIPQKPQKPTEGDSSGTISDDLKEAAKIFSLSGVTVSTENGSEVLRGEWTVDGLTDYGRTLAEIEIPDTLARLPVSKIADGCFRNNTSVEKIVIGSKISAIGNNAFEGCSRLRAIYIKSNDPATFSPPPDFLDGLDGCTVYVPRSAYNDYLFDYFWSYIGDKLAAY